MVRKKKDAGRGAGTVSSQPGAARSPEPVKARPPADANALKAYATVDYPQDGEIVTSPRYTIRVTTSATAGVAVSIDGKDWAPCRESVGHWWYDWSGYGAGPHTVLARIGVGKRTLKSKARAFTVLI